MITTRSQRNPFDLHDLVVDQVDVKPGGTLADYCPIEVNEHVVCVRNGKVHRVDSWSRVRPIDGDDLFYLERPDGGYIVAAIGTAYGIGALVTTAGTLTTTGVIVAAVINVGIAIGLSYAIRALMGQPESPDRLLGSADSRVHTFSGIKTAASVGEPIPVVYGEHVIGGLVLESFVTSGLIVEPNEPAATDFPVSHLNYKVALCEGEIDEILAVYLSGNDTELLPRVIVENRLGTNTQSPIQMAGLDETRQDQDVGTVLENRTTDPELGTVVGLQTTGLVNALYVNIGHPRGCYHLSVFGGFFPLTIEVEVRVKPVSSGTWGSWRPFEYSMKSVSPFIASLHIGDLNRDQYDVQIRRVTPEVGTSQYGAPIGDDYIFETEVDSLSEIIQESFAHPNTALLSLRVPADGNFNSSSIPSLTVLLRGRKIEAWNPDDEEWQTRDTHPSGVDILSNPAWIVIDMLTNRRFGMGALYDRDFNFDLDNWAEFAAWCDELVDDGSGGYERRCRFDGVFEGTESLWSSVIRVLNTARAVPIPVGDVIRVKWERPRPFTYSFNTSNVLPGSFTEQRVSTRSRATRMEVRFLDSDRSYTPDIAQSEDLDALDRGEPLRVAVEDMFGITRRSQAARQARYLLNLGRLDTVLAWGTSADAVVCEVGDLVKFSHEEPLYGIADGRLQGGSASTIVVDNEFTLLEGVTYEVTVRHSADDVIEVRKIASEAGTYSPGDTLTVDEDFDSAVGENDLYSVGQLSLSTVPVLVSAIEVNEDLTATFLGIKYDEGIHDDLEIIDNEIEYSALPDPAALPACLAEAPSVIETLVGGSPYLFVSWQYTTTDIAGARIWTRRDGTVWTLAAEVSPSQSSAQVGPVAAGASYEVTVLQVSGSGVSRAPGDCPIATIVPDGVGDVPGAIEGLSVVQASDQVVISWTPVTVPFVPAYYAVRRGEAWNLSRSIGTTPGSELITDQWAPSSGSSNPGVERFWVSAVSPTGIYGPPASFDIALGNWFSGAIDFQRDEFDLGWPGTLDNLVVDGSGFLVLDDPADPGTYETPNLQIDALLTSTFRIGAIAWAYMEGGPTLGSQNYAGSSLQGKTWNLHGPLDPTQWLASVVWEIKVAATSGGLASAPWQPLRALNYADTMWCRIRVTVTTTDTDWLPRVSYLYLSAEETP